jgi:hypothetical protein
MSGSPSWSAQVELTYALATEDGLARLAVRLAQKAAERAGVRIRLTRTRPRASRQRP